MAAVLGILEEREAAARVRVEGLREEVTRLAEVLEAAEIELDRRVIAREELVEALAASAAESTAGTGTGTGTGTGAERESGPSRVPVPGSVVPVRREGLDVTVLPPDYQRIMHVLTDRERSGEGPAICRQLADALDLEPVPAKIEGVRSKTKRLAARGWLVEKTPGSFSVAASRGGGS
ncbi:hypothetical protein SHIRM173S_12671 [Streptomyces hirsutus]